MKEKLKYSLAIAFRYWIKLGLVKGDTNIMDIVHLISEVEYDYNQKHQIVFIDPDTIMKGERGERPKQVP